MSKRTEQELSDVFKWWKYNKDTISDVDKRVEFLEACFNNMFFVLCGISEDVKHLENTYRPDLRFHEQERPELVLPKGVKLGAKP